MYSSFSSFMETRPPQTFHSPKHNMFILNVFIHGKYLPNFKYSYIYT